METVNSIISLPKVYYRLSSGYSGSRNNYPPLKRKMLDIWLCKICNRICFIILSPDVKIIELKDQCSHVKGHADAQLEYRGMNIETR